MDIREGLKKIKNTDNKLISGDNEIEYSAGVFWKKIDGCSQRLEYIPIEFEVLDWKVKDPEPTLKEMLSKLEVREFVPNCYNYYITLYNSGISQEWKTDFSWYHKHFGEIYFDEYMIKKVVDYMNKKRISWNEFIKTWEEVQKERGE